MSQSAFFLLWGSFWWKIMHTMMMYFAHADHEGADEIEAGFRAALFRDFVLQHAVVAA